MKYKNSYLGFEENPKTEEECLDCTRPITCLTCGRCTKHCRQFNCIEDRSTSSILHERNVLRALDETASASDAFTDEEKERHRKNPGEKWAYVAVAPTKFDGVVAKGLTTATTDHGRGVAFTTNPRVAQAIAGEMGEIIRFPMPSGAVKTGGSPYEYNMFVGAPVKRGELEVFLSGHIGEDINWIPIGQLR